VSGDEIIPDLYARIGDDDLELRDGVTEACLSVHGQYSNGVWLQPEHIVELRDWCTEWLTLHNTLRFGGTE
jgi:hypothetical protein